MGEATYYLKALFPEDISEELEEQITEFIKEGQTAYEWWQNHRMCPEPQRFWDRFTVKFPVVTEYLGDLVGGGCNNELSGMLDFGDDNELENIEINDYELIYSCTCWHFASWDRFATFLQQKFGAETVNWLSEEDIDPFELL